MLFLLVSCASKGDKTSETYIDTKQFFETEIKKLTLIKTGVQKQLWFDGKQQTTSTQNVDWIKELDAFLSIDLQKASYKGRFDIDTLITNDTLYEVRYTANDIKVDLHSCVFKIQTSDQKMSSIVAVFGDRNSLYQSVKILSYTVGKGYTVSGKQAVKLGNEIEYKIIANFEIP